MTKAQANKALFAVMLVVLFSSAGIALPYPVLAPIFLNEVNNLTTFAGLPNKILLGIILAMYPLGILIGCSVIGAASGFYGRKKTLVITLILSALSYLLSAVAVFADNYLLLLFARFISGIFSGNISIAKAIAVDLSPTLDKTHTFNLVNATSYAGWLLGPLIGGILGIYGLELVFYCAVLASFIALVCVLLLLAEDIHTSNQSIKFSQLFARENSFALLTDVKIRRIFFIYLLGTLGLNAYYEFYPLWLVEQFHFSSDQIGYLTVVLTFSMVISSVFLVNKIKATFGLKRGAIIGMLAMASLFMIHPLLSLTSVWFVYIAIGAAIAIFNSLLPVYISEEYHQLEQGQLMGLITTTFGLANVLIALVGSLLALFGAHWAILFGALLLVIASVDFSKNKHTLQSNIALAQTSVDKTKQVNN